MTWWCVALREPWRWAWRPYPGVWLLVATCAVGYLRAVRRGDASPRQRRRFLVGLAVLWVASDWPVGTLAAGYLATAHMVQYLLYTLVAAPLLVLGTPEPLARRILARLRCYRATAALCRPAPAAVFFNATLFVTHVPWAVDGLRANQAGSFVLDMAWLVSGLVLWLPVVGPLSELRIRSQPLRMAYLFFAAGFVAWVPASFLVFASFPLYRTFELAPRAFGLDALADQQAAGLVMKFGTTPVVWGVIAVMWWRWWLAEGADRRGPRAGRSSHRRSGDERARPPLASGHEGP